MCLSSYTATLHFMKESEIEQAAYLFALLGDPTRLRILHAVLEQGERSVHEIAEIARVSRFNTSAHLNRLALGGLVARRREASTVYYRVDDRNLATICALICESLRARTDALRSLRAAS